MLPHTYRFVALNETGQTIASGNITVKSRRWKLDSNGALSYEPSEGSPYTMDEGGGLTDGSYDAGDTIDNSTNKWMGGACEATITTPAAASGDVTLFLQSSTNAGTTWPENGEGVPVLKRKMGASETKVFDFYI